MGWRPPSLLIRTALLGEIREQQVKDWASRYAITMGTSSEKPLIMGSSSSSSP